MNKDTETPESAYFRKINERKRITLISLVIAIILLIILAGVTIVQLAGNGLFGKAKLEENLNTNITFEPNEYTNKESANILVKISNSKGIKSIKCPDNDTIYPQKNQTEVGIDYIVTNNDSYTYIVTDSEGIEEAVTVEVDIFDRLDPEDFTPKYEDLATDGFTIVANAKDSEATETSSMSGIAKYEYYVNGTKYESDQEKYTIAGLNKGTQYTVYVVAYDKAGNSKTSSKINITTYTNPIPPSIVILEKGGFPVFSTTGVTVSDSIFQLESSESNIIKNYYSVDEGQNWELYTAPVTTTSTKIMAKSVMELDNGSFLESEVVTQNVSYSPYVILKEAGYDGDATTEAYVGNVRGVMFGVDSSTWGSNLATSIILRGNSPSAIGTRTYAFDFINSSGEVIETSKQYGCAFRATVSTLDNIPDGTVLVRLRSISNSIYYLSVKEVSIQF